MQIKTKHLKNFISELKSRPITDLDELISTVQTYAAQEERAEFIATTIQGILKHNSLYKRPDLSVELLKQLGAESYFKEMIPKVFFGRQQGHSTGIATFIRNNANVNVIVVTSTSSLVAHVKDTLKNSHIEDVPVFSLSNPSSIRKIPEGTDLILVDEYPNDRSMSYQTLLSLVSNSVYTGTPLITLGTMF